MLLPNAREFEPVSKQLTIVIGLTVVGFMAFGLALSFYRNILFEKTLDELEQENRVIADHIDGGYRNLEYYKSDQYRDKFAKENLNRLNPGEKVIIITTPPSAMPGSSPLETDTERQEAAYFELLRQMPVIEHWKLYFFGKERIEELKTSL
jgi:cell division protein FtsB